MPASTGKRWDLTLLLLAARGIVGLHPGLIVRVRPATPFERATWADCSEDGMRILVDEDGTMPQNLSLADQLPQAAFVSLKEWRRLLRQALRVSG